MNNGVQYYRLSKNDKSCAESFPPLEPTPVLPLFDETLSDVCGRPSAAGLNTEGIGFDTAFCGVSLIGVPLRLPPLLLLSSTSNIEERVWVEGSTGLGMGGEGILHCDWEFCLTGD